MRMTNPAHVLPDAAKGIGHLFAGIMKSGLPKTTAELVGIRASMINGCAACLEAHQNEGRKAGLTNSQIVGVGAWREGPWYSDAERAALALTDAMTRMADAEDAVPDELWREVSKHYDEKQLAGLLLEIGMINLFNQISVTIREDAEAPSWA